MKPKVRQAPKTWVFLFDELDKVETTAKPKDWEDVRSLLGGKGANLFEMTRLGLPVPPGFTVTTEACNGYLADNHEFPTEHVGPGSRRHARGREKVGKNFGDPKNPLFVSCRSGAKFSMPGMMDTVLNIGLNDETAKGMIELTGDPRFVYDSYRRLIQMFGSVVMGVADEPFEEVIAEVKKKRGVRHDVELTAEDWQQHDRALQGAGQRLQGPGIPAGPVQAARNGHPRRLQQLVWQARDRLSQRHQHQPRPGHGRQHRDHGLWQHGQ